MPPIELQPSRVLVVTASEVIKSGLSSMLATLPEVRAVDDRSELAVELLASGGVSVLVTSPPLPDEEYDEIAEAAARGHAQTLVLLRDYDLSDRDIINQAVSLPADGYILESGLTQDSLADTLRLLHQGQAPMPTVLTRGLVSRVGRSEPRPAERPFLLTAREIQVLSLLASGQSNKEIARHLLVSEHGAKRYVAGLQLHGRGVHRLRA